MNLMNRIEEINDFIYFFGCIRGLFESIDAEAAAAAAAAQRRVGRAAEYHVPDVLVSAHLRHLLLPQWRHLLHHQNRRIHPLQLRVSFHFFFTIFSNFF